MEDRYHYICGDCEGMTWADLGYSCPTCGWPTPEYDGGYFQIDEDGDYITVPGKWNEETKKAEFTPLYPDQPMYPKFGPIRQSLDGVLDWEETWYCPFCKQEFTFENGT
jgi:hypothetical protein